VTESAFYVLAIDPGPEQSAFAWLDSNLKPVQFDHVINTDLLLMIQNKCSQSTPVVIEMVASYGMAVGREVFDTCVWIGRFTQAAVGVGAPVTPLRRIDVKLNLCHSSQAKDKNVRRALLDRFGTVGTRKNPGWFYGFKSDVWSAYAVGVTYFDIRNGLYTPHKVV